MKIKFLKDHRIISHLASVAYAKNETIEIDEAHGAALVKAGWAAEVPEVRAEAQSAQSPSPKA